MTQKSIHFTHDQREKILRDMWIMNDARWFLKSIMKFDFENAMILDLDVVKSFGKTEMKRMLLETGIREIKNIKQFKALVELASDLYFPDEHKYEFEIQEDNSLLAKVLQCYTYIAVSKAGITNLYQCAAKTRFDSWLEACDLNGKIIVDKNTHNCNGSCNIIFNIKW